MDFYIEINREEAEKIGLEYPGFYAGESIIVHRHPRKRKSSLVLVSHNSFLEQELPDYRELRLSLSNSCSYPGFPNIELSIFLIPYESSKEVSEIRLILQAKTYRDYEELYREIRKIEKLTYEMLLGASIGDLYRNDLKWYWDGLEEFILNTF